MLIKFRADDVIRVKGPLSICYLFSEAQLANIKTAPAVPSIVGSFVE